MIDGQSKDVFAAWLVGRPQDWRDAVEVVAMNGFTGFKNAAVQELLETMTVMDPFHFVRLAGQAVDGVCRRRQQELHGDRGRKDDPLYRIRRVLRTGADLLSVRQWGRLNALFRHGVSGDGHVEVSRWRCPRWSTSG